MTPQELKASILQMAIQGKLVEQRPDEGTGEELYGQIQFEKQALIKAGKIKKEKARAEITEDENRKQTIYKKYAPVLFVRDMYAKSTDGNSTPGWYAGADMVRKISQGNPRLFIQLMHALFDRAKDTALEPKEQHRVLIQFADKICGATRSLQSQGPIIGSNLEKVAKNLHDRVHGKYIVNNGTSFVLSFKDKSDLEKNRSWLQLAIAHSRLIVDDEVKKSKIEQDTTYLLSNSYAALYWLPMRKGDTISINSDDVSADAKETEIKVSTRVRPRVQTSEQLSFFDCLEGDS